MRRYRQRGSAATYIKKYVMITWQGGIKAIIKVRWRPIVDSVLTGITVDSNRR